ncbi:MAG: hypothetical protein IT382_24645, partial [Deltaproteobacteria bacterium]|nr:hypothetical protein [Deltaproteobacteria bacterium]
ANRFLPGIRTTFILGAGLFRVPLRDVVIFGGISALLWNALLIGVGWLLGANLDRLQGWLTDYTLVGWIVVAVVVIAAVARALFKRRRRTPAPSRPHAGRPAGRPRRLNRGRAWRSRRANAATRPAAAAGA